MKITPEQLERAVLNLFSLYYGRRVTSVSAAFGSGSPWNIGQDMERLFNEQGANGILSMLNFLINDGVLPGGAAVIPPHIKDQIRVYYETLCKEQADSNYY